MPNNSYNTAVLKNQSTFIKYAFKIILYLLLSLNGSTLLSQNHEINSFKLKADKIWCDRFNNVYGSLNASLEKSSQPYLKNLSYANYSLGFISQVNVDNPLKIFIYYESFNKAIFLDQYLKELKTIDLNSIDINFNKTLVSPSNKGGLWIFNGKNYRLEYYNQNLQLQYKTQDLTVINNFNVFPQQINEWNDKVYLLFPENNVLVFNVLGNFIKSIPLLEGNHFKIIENKLFYVYNNRIEEFNLETGEKIILPFVIERPVADFTVNNHYVYILSKNMVYIFNRK